VALRRQYAVLRSRHFLHGQSEPAPGVSDIGWYDKGGNSIPDSSWTNREERLLSLRRAARNDDATVSVLTLMLNPTPDAQEFQLPGPAMPSRVLIDTTRPQLKEFDLADQKVAVAARGAVLVHSLLERPAQ
jgi:glycogen operon protein